MGRLGHTGDKRQTLGTRKEEPPSFRTYPFLQTKPADGAASYNAANSTGYLSMLQGPGLDALDKERRIVGVHMEQPPFIEDIPSSGLAPPQVDGSFLHFFQVLLEHSGDVAGLHGALLNKSGAKRACSDDP